MKPLNRHAVGVSIGLVIKTRRRELGLSLDDLAGLCECSKTHIWEMEKGRSLNPSIWLLLALCRGLQCSFNSLLGIDVSQPEFSDKEMRLIAAHREIFK